jgi:hypothetical protein
MLQVQAAQRALARFTQIVLNKVHRHALLAVAVRCPRLQKIAALVPEHSRFDQQDAWKYRFADTHVALPLSSVTCCQ